MTKTVEAFDAVKTALNGPLLIEASAGTGKTYSLMHLILRLLVEKDFPVNTILVVTFTKAATYELKSRLRSVLTELTEQIADAQFDLNRFRGKDELQRRQLQKWIDDGLSLSDIYQKLFAALQLVDDAAIFTIHGFCQRMLNDFVFSSHGSYDFGFGEGQIELEESLDRFMRRRLPQAELTSEEALSLLKDTQWKEFVEKISILPRGKPLDNQIRFIKALSKEGVEEAIENPRVLRFLKRFLDEASAEYREAKRKSRIFTFDDLLSETEERVSPTKPKSGPEADTKAEKNAFVAEIRKLFNAALIDEFQDTDPLQYSIFKQLFVDDTASERPVIFVGDPKQSIYSFRNADLDTYLQAREDLGRTLELVKNFRSTPGIIEAVNTIFQMPSILKRERERIEEEKKAQEEADAAAGKKKKGGAKKIKPVPDDEVAGESSFLDPDLTYSDVQFNEKKLPLMEKLPDGTFKPLPSFVFLSNLENPTQIDSESCARLRRALIVQDIARLLSGNVFYNDRRLRPSDIAVLVRSKNSADPLIRLLRRLGIKSTIARSERVTDSKESREIYRVISAMTDTKNLKSLASARATEIFGETLSSILNDTRKASAARVLLDEAYALYQKKGIIAAFSKIFEANGTEERILKMPDGERALTNYQHLLEILHQAGKRIHTLQGLLRWLDEPKNKAESEDENLLTLRRETDSDVVRFVTIHSSKGLQYPVVYLGDAQYGISKNGPDYCTYKEKTDAQPKQTRWVFSLKDSPLPAANLRAARAEGARLIYVALTRAAARLVIPYFCPMAKNGVNGAGHAPVAFLAHALTGAEKAKAYLPAAAEQLRVALDNEGSHAGIVRNALKEAGVPRDLLSLQAIEDYQPFAINNRLGLEDLPLFPTIPYRFDQTESLRAGPWTSTSINWRSSSFSGLIKAAEQRPTLLITDEPESDEGNHEQGEAGTFGDARFAMKGESHFAKGNTRQNRTDPSNTEQRNVENNGADQNNAAHDNAAPDNAAQNSAAQCNAKKGEAAEETRALGGVALSAHAQDKSTEEGFGFEDRDYLAVMQLNRAANEFGTDFHALMEKLFARKIHYSPETTILHFLNALYQYIPKDEENPEALKKSIEKDLFAALDEILGVPFIAELPEFCLRDILASQRKRLPEINFLISVGKPVEGRLALTAERLGNALAQLDPEFSGLNLQPTELQGYLNGSIDLAFEAGNRFWILDWKTNYLGETPSRYTQEAMAKKMTDNHYRLQYLIYLIALKRLLEVRLGVSNGYELIGGAAYFFVRGVRKADPHQGIFTDRPNDRMIEIIDDFLKHGFDQRILDEYGETQGLRSFGKPNGVLNKPSGGLNRPNGDLSRPNGDLNRPSGGLSKPSDSLGRSSDGLDKTKTQSLTTSGAENAQGV